jgi:HEAT repeat protein
MPRSRATLVVVFVFATCVTIPVAGRQEGEPEYDGKKGSAWVDTLVNDTSARKRALAVDALAKLWADKQFKDSLPAIGRALRLDSSTAVRARAAIALGSLKENDIKFAAKDLVDALGSEKEPRVRKEIALAIGRFPVVARLAIIPLTDALSDPDPATRAAVAEAIALTGTEGKSAAAGLAPLLQDNDKSVRRAAIVALGRIAPEGAATLAETMSGMLTKEKDGDIRIELVTSLGLLGEKSPVVVKALAAILTDPDDEMRRKSTRILGGLGTAAEPAADALLQTAGHDKLKDIRADAVHSFGSALGPGGLKVRIKDLLGLLKDPEHEVRLAVVEEVGALGNDLKDDTETLKTLRGRLSDPHLKVRESVQIALRRIEKKPEPKKEP